MHSSFAGGGSSSGSYATDWWSILRDPSASPWVATFEFDDSRTDIPLVTWTAPLVAIAIYLSTIVAIKAWISRCHKPFQLKQFVIFYNALLSVLSFVLFTHLAHHLVALIRATSFLDVFCNPRHLSAVGITGTLPFLYYCNYLLKYLEFADTVLLCLRGKPTPFLHVYHHAATLLLCFTQLRAQTCLQWVFIVLNLFVHVFLYAYYALHESGGRVWWKRYLTIGQIGQFVIDLAAALVGMAIRLAWEIDPGWSYECHGNWSGALSGFAIVFSYLVLFIKLYRDTYQRKHSEDTSKSKQQQSSPTSLPVHARPMSSTASSSSSAFSSSSTLAYRRPHTLVSSPAHASASML